MYFPFLRGRQFELIAMREFAAQTGKQQQIIPIFEPVESEKSGVSALLRGAKILDENQTKFVVVLNSPFSKLGSIQLLDQLIENIEDTTNLISGLHVAGDYWDIRNQILNIQGDVMLVCSDSTDASNEDFLELLRNERVKFVLSKDNRRLFRRAADLGKKFIRWDDNFNKQNKNSDYLKLGEEKFTEEHLYYLEDGNFGFCDFGPLSSQFVKGGTMPYAISIHLTYRKDNGEIWIRHFTSMSNDDQANVQGKFAEAAAKAIKFLNDMQIETEAANELRFYFDNGKFPGLGMVKKISIKHHLELVNGLLA